MAAKSQATARCKQRCVQCFSKFQADLELHQEFNMTTQDQEPDSTNPKVKRLQKIVEGLSKKKANDEAKKEKEKQKQKEK